MSLDTATDDLVDGLRAIARTEVTAALASLTGDVPAIRETRGLPIPLEMLETAALPVLGVFVEREASVATTSRHVDRLLTVGFEFFAPATPLAKLDLRWPILRKVWDALLETIGDGLLAGQAVLEGIGVLNVDVETATVDYDFATDGASAYPHFLGRISIRQRPLRVSAELMDLRELFARFNRVDGEPVLQPQVEVIARTEAGALAVEGSGDPLDPDSEDA